ncbi:MAG: hypothetical protein QMD50_02875 [Patescibacteria group bacterium]|nr:hypothetical protein [Patescibacteria group bacterium]
MKRFFSISLFLVSLFFILSSNGCYTKFSYQEDNYVKQDSGKADDLPFYFDNIFGEADEINWGPDGPPLSDSLEKAFMDDQNDSYASYDQKKKIIYNYFYFYDDYWLPQIRGFWFYYSPPYTWDYWYPRPYWYYDHYYFWDNYWLFHSWRHYPNGWGWWNVWPYWHHHFWYQYYWPNYYNNYWNYYWHNQNYFNDRDRLGERRYDGNVRSRDSRRIQDNNIIRDKNARRTRDNGSVRDKNIRDQKQDGIKKREVKKPEQPTPTRPPKDIRIKPDDQKPPQRDRDGTVRDQRKKSQKPKVTPPRQNPNPNEKRPPRRDDSIRRNPPNRDRSYSPGYSNPNHQTPSVRQQNSNPPHRSDRNAPSNTSRNLDNRSKPERKRP